MTSSGTEPGLGPDPSAESTDAGVRPLLAESSSGGIPPQTAEQREARERAYNLYSAAIGACLARRDKDPSLLERAALLLVEEARLPYLTPDDIARANGALPGIIDELRADPVRPPAGASPQDLGRELSEADLNSLFGLALRDRLTGIPREQPRLLLFGGQPGSGKSTLQRLVLPVLPEGTVSYDGDDLLRLSPDYEWSMTADDRVASTEVSKQVGGLHGLAMEHVRQGRYDAVCSHPLGRADWAASWVLGFKEAGYRVEVAFVATHTSNSRFSIFDRHERATRDQGFGRFLPEIHHDRFYLGVPNTVEFLETHQLADSVYVLSREGEVLYANHQRGGQWRTEPFGRIALEAERGRRELWRSEDTL
ncbi:zeta toxin family protein [Nocardiopsis valliformis]|uniref:zeta toxin family protein n=1 Tax=Nocardiopsis valliformis TaxID=239974 RepID=UPI00034C4386|nr:zeta toxin family protein [Nocardiopsis valliformis]